MQLATEEVLAQDTRNTVIAAEIPSGTLSKTPAELADIVSTFASSVGWMDRVRLRTEDRWYERLYHGPDYDIWAISWMPGQSTGFHDHGESSGAFVVATGILQEHRHGEQPLAIPPGQPRTFGPDYTHDVRNVYLAPAISIHAYSPPLNEMNEYELHGDQLVPREVASERVETLDRETHGQEWQVQRSKPAARTGATSIEQVLSAARARLQRLSPEEAHDAVANAGAVLVDIRPEAQRAIEGSIPGALLVERNVLEWRFDPASSARLPVATDHDLQVIVFCSEGYTSSLAAAALQDLGLWRATDIVGGFHAWHAKGLRIVPPR
ncbi:rhodanese-like domain-containing protein [Terriglobus saanensis]|uniref:Cysteine dioxygenase type I n=1 Tax=Terriglobus saanensis (strain ATCC BAA-1853 / DSM 23119 / SP1PR4) TaxID=401053 RepID=E8UY92_TERSS|nr:rhodanese-like domain-containing protein [Terriglobus saanensis]ADV80902.1 cysteine dioxygenase type I [Terriglobus saanensis SP1PR4]